jgi:phospholipase/carboxylesterase
VVVDHDDAWLGAVGLLQVAVPSRETYLGRFDGKSFHTTCIGAGRKALEGRPLRYFGRLNDDAGTGSLTLVHEIRPPAQGKPEGALVLLHGRGADEHDLVPLLDVLDPERRLLGLTPGAPLTNVPPGGRHWYLVPRVGYPDHDTFHSSYSLLTSFLDETLAAKDISWEQTVIGGFSMGAVMSYAVALGDGRPSPRAIIAMSGFIPTVEGWRAELSGREGLPVLIHHGRRDPVIEVEFGRQAAELLRSGGLDVTYLESDAGHWLPPEAVEQAASLMARLTRAS